MMRFAMAPRSLMALGVFLLTVSIGSAQNSADVSGIWRTAGYAWTFEITPTAVTAYQVTDTTCVLVFKTNDVVYEGDTITAKNAQFPGVAALLDDPSDFTLALEGDTLLFDSSGVVPLVASRVETLPASCADGVEASSDPGTVFEVFWHMFAENYAFFDLYGVDWQAVYETYRPQVTAETTDEALFDVLEQALTGLNDAHINLIASPTQVYSGGQYAEWTQDQDDAVVAAAVDLITEKYVQDAKVLANETILYGHLSETVGYINVLAMQGFGEEGQDIAAIDEAMLTIAQDLADTDTIVVDVRFNGGGDDANAIAIASYFADEKRLAFSKAAWDGRAFLEAHDIFVEPAIGARFTQDVYLLISNYTTSAGEVFVLAMGALPQVTRVGETTQGAFSDILPVFLPNGWFLTLSNERYAAHDGVVYEGPGIPPQREAPMSSEALQSGKDPVLDFVLDPGQTPDK